MTTQTKIFWYLLVGSAGAFGVLGAWQHSRAVTLRVERDQLLTEQLKRTGARASSRDAQSNELARLRAQSDELRRTREALATVERAMAGEKVSAPPRASTTAELPALSGPMVKSADWRDAGAASPQAAIESIVWAASRGETERFGSLLAIDERGRKELAEAFARLSPESQASYLSPENMLATLLVVQVPQDLSAIGAVNSLALNSGDIAVRTRLERGGMAAKDGLFVFRLTEGRWQLVIPREVAVGAVAAALKASGVAAGR